MRWYLTFFYFIFENIRWTKILDLIETIVLFLFLNMMKNMRWVII
jgi:quinol-cytochrome oxidoreductase complex cytochrome b subunit